MGTLSGESTLSNCFCPNEKESPPKGNIYFPGSIFFLWGAYSFFLGDYFSEENWCAVMQTGIHKKCLLSVAIDAQFPLVSKTNHLVYI